MGQANPKVIGPPAMVETAESRNGPNRERGGKPAANRPHHQSAVRSFERDARADLHGIDPSGAWLWSTGPAMYETRTGIRTIAKLIPNC